MGQNLLDAEVGDWLKPGEYLVKVTGHTTKKIGDKHAYEFILETDEGEMTRKVIYRTEKAKMFYAKFARRCGLTDVEMQDVEPEMLHGRYLIVTVEPDDDPKFASVKDNYRRYEPEASEPPTGKTNSERKAAEAEREAAPSPIQDDDIPF